MMTQTTAQTIAPQPLGLSRRPSPSEAMFDAFRAQDRPAFIGYMPYGFPDSETTHDALRTMSRMASTRWRSACPTPIR